MGGTKHRYYLVGLSILLLTTLLHSADSNVEPTHTWPQFRGPDGLANAGDQDIPLHFGQTENLLWRTEVLKGHSSPIIWGRNLFLTGFKDETRIMLAIDRFSGQTLWEKKAEAPATEDFTHRLASPAESTPCTDGKHVYFYFGNYGLIALNFDGSVAWEKRLPRPSTGMGTGTSPILSGESLILNRDGTDEPWIRIPEKNYGSTHVSVTTVAMPPPFFGITDCGQN